MVTPAYVMIHQYDVLEDTFFAYRLDKVAMRVILLDNDDWEAARADYAKRNGRLPTDLPIPGQTAASFARAEVKNPRTSTELDGVVSPDRQHQSFPQLNQRNDPLPTMAPLPMAFDVVREAQRLEAERMRLMQSTVDQLSRVTLNQHQMSTASQLNAAPLAAPQSQNSGALVNMNIFLKTMTKFSGEPDLFGNNPGYQDWSKEYVGKGTAQGMTEAQLATNLIFLLKGRAYEIYDRLTAAVKSSWQLVNVALRDELDPNRSFLAKKQYDDLRMKTGQPFPAFVAEMKRLYFRAYPNQIPDSIAADEQLVLKLFECLPGELRAVCKSQPLHCDTLERLTTLVEHSHKLGISMPPGTPTLQTPAPTRLQCNAVTMGYGPPAFYPTMPQQQWTGYAPPYGYGMAQHPQWDPQWESNARGPTASQPQWTGYQQHPLMQSFSQDARGLPVSQQQWFGYGLPQGPQLAQQPPYEQPKTRQPQGGTTDTCYNCGSNDGHYSRDCQQPLTDRTIEHRKLLAAGGKSGSRTSSPPTTPTTTASTSTAQNLLADSSAKTTGPTTTNTPNQTHSAMVMSVKHQRIVVAPKTDDEDSPITDDPILVPSDTEELDRMALTEMNSCLRSDRLLLERTGCVSARIATVSAWCNWGWTSNLRMAQYIVGVILTYVMTILWLLLSAIEMASDQNDNGMPITNSNSPAALHVLMRKQVVLATTYPRKTARVVYVSRCHSKGQSRKCDSDAARFRTNLNVSLAHPRVQLLKPVVNANSDVQALPGPSVNELNLGTLFSSTTKLSDVPDVLEYAGKLGADFTEDEWQQIWVLASHINDDNIKSNRLSYESARLSNETRIIGYKYTAHDDYCLSVDTHLGISTLLAVQRCNLMDLTAVRVYDLYRRRQRGRLEKSEEKCSVVLQQTDAKYIGPLTKLELEHANRVQEAFNDVAELAELAKEEADGKLKKTSLLCDIETTDTESDCSPLEDNVDGDSQSKPPQKKRISTLAKLKRFKMTVNNIARQREKTYQYIRDRTGKEYPPAEKDEEFGPMEQPPLIVEGRIENVACLIMLDTGASSSFMSLAFLKRFFSHAELTPLQSDPKACGYGGAEFDLVGCAQLKVKVANHTRDVEFFISAKKEQQVILGRDWLNMMGYMAMDCGHGYIQFGNSSRIQMWPNPRTILTNE